MAGVNAAGWAATWSGVAVAGWVLTVGLVAAAGRPSVARRARLRAVPGRGPEGGQGPGGLLGTVLGRALRRAAVPWPAGRVAAAWGAAVGAAVVAAAVLPAGPGVVVVAGTTLGPVIALRTFRNRALQRAEAGLPVALDGVARALRTGAGMRQALVEVAAGTPDPLGTQLMTAGRHPGGLVAGLEAWAAEHRSGDIQLTAAALCLAAESGGAASRATEGLATTLRQRAENTAEIRTLATQTRLSALVIGLLPVGFASLAALGDPAVAHFLFATPLGTGCLVGGLALDAAGAWWMLRLTAGGPR